MYTQFGSILAVVIIVIIVVLLVLFLISGNKQHKKHKHKKGNIVIPPPIGLFPSEVPTCDQVQGLFTLNPNPNVPLQDILIPGINVPNKENLKILVTVHGYGTIAGSMLSVAQFFQSARYPDTNKPYYDAILLAQYNPFTTRFEDISNTLVQQLQPLADALSDVRIDFATQSLGNQLTRYAIEVVKTKYKNGSQLGDHVGALFSFSGANYCTPNSSTFPISQLIVAGVAERIPGCAAAVNPAILIDSGDCPVPTPINDSPALQQLNSLGSPFRETIKYFSLGGNVPVDGLTGNPFGATLGPIYDENGYIPTDGTIWLNSTLGLGILESKSNFLAEHSDLTRKILPHDHTTMEGQHSFEGTAFLTPLPADVQLILLEWLKVAF